MHFHALYTVNGDTSMQTIVCVISSFLSRDEAIGTHFIDLNEIFDMGSDGMPIIFYLNCNMLGIILVRT